MCVTSASGGNFDATSNPQRATWLIQDDCSFWPEHNHQISVYSANSMRELCSFKDCLPGLTETWTSRNVIYIRLWLWFNLYLVTISTFHHLNKGRSDVRLHVSKPAFNWREFFFSQRNNTSVNNPPSHQPTHSAVCVCVCDLIQLDVARGAHVFPASALKRRCTTNTLQKMTYCNFIIPADSIQYFLEMYVSSCVLKMSHDS